MFEVCDVITFVFVNLWGKLNYVYILLTALVLGSLWFSSIFVYKSIVKLLLRWSMKLNIPLSKNNNSFYQWWAILMKPQQMIYTYTLYLFTSTVWSRIWAMCAQYIVFAYCRNAVTCGGDKIQYFIAAVIYINFQPYLSLFIMKELFD